MTRSITVEQTSAEDFAELMDMLIRAFQANRPVKRPFQALFPDLYRPTDQNMRSNYVIRKNGKIAACVGLFPMRILICERTVTIAGIGGVSTLQDFRRQGLMRTLMQHVQKEIIDQGYPFSWLGGDRRRYMHWGYENTVNRFSFTMTPRAPGFAEFADTLTEPMKTADLDRSEWATIWQQAQKNPKLIVCGQEILKLKYQRLDQKVYYTGGPDGAHIVVFENDSKNELRAWAGDPQKVAALIAAYITRDDDNAPHRLDAMLPWYPDHYCPVFKQLMAHYALASGGMIAVVDLEKTFNVFKDHFDRRVRQFNLTGKVTLKVGPCGQIPTQQILLEADCKQLAISKPTTTAPNCLELTRFQIVELMFTPLVVGYSVKLDPQVRWITTLFPVPFYLPGVFNV